MMNQDNPYAMNQTCKVCGEPAAGFHFGAFTCEGCKSFFGRSYNNLSSISDCKNNGECVINKKNRTACKACRLRKCLLVGMSKSGSRYGRRSNWFKIHCLLQEQQQQAAAAMAAHHSNQQQQHAAAAAAAAAAAQQHTAPPSMLPGQKPPQPISVGGVPPPPSPSAAAAAALGMLGHAGAYPGLYPPRTKEELMMLGLEEYTKHPATASSSVSSPDSHNSDSSMEVNVRGNTLLHLSGKHETATGVPTSPQLRKDLPHFLPLPFPGLASMPVMPPPAFLPPSHLLFPGYHPALYQHHQGLLKPSPEQQQAVAAAAAVQHLFNSSNVAPNRFPPTFNSPTSPLTVANKLHLNIESHPQSSKNDTLNNNHIPNGSKAAEELTKRFYLEAVLKSQRSSPPPAATKLPAHPKHDHSISALVTPNSESGQDRFKSRDSNDGTVAEEKKEENKGKEDNNDSDCGEDLVVSMTPPRSPANPRVPKKATAVAQDDPIDLSMKTSSSLASSLSSKCSSIGSIQTSDSENENDMEVEKKQCDDNSRVSVDERSSKYTHHEELQVEDDDTSTIETVKTYICGTTVSNTNNSNNNNKENAETVKIDSSDSEQGGLNVNAVKHKLETDVNQSTEEEISNTKRAKLLDCDNVERPVLGLKIDPAALDLTTKI